MSIASMNAEKMKPCPFCGPTSVAMWTPNVVVKEVTTIHPGSGKTKVNMFWVVCPMCESTGPLQAGQQAAIRSWNFRRQPKDDGDDIGQDILGRSNY